MRRLRSLFLALAVVAVGAITVPGLTADPQLPLSNAADDEALVEIHLADRTAIDPLLDMGLDLAEYVREEPGGIVTAAFVTPAERAFLETLGYVFGRTVEDRSTWEARKRERQDAMADEQAAQGVAEEGLEAEIPGVIPSLAPSMSASTADAGPGEEEPPGEVTIMRADYFVHRSGRFLSVEARTALGTNSGGPTMAVSWAEDGGAYGTATTMSKFTDAGAYMYHRTLLRMGAAGSTTPVPHMVRVASSTGEFAEDEVRTWPGEDLPPYAEEYLTGFHTHYMDPVEVYDRINDLAAEFPNISEIMDLPYQTNGYQRKAMAVMGASTAGGSPSDTSRAVLLISQAWGHEGGNDVQAEFLPSASATTTIAVTGSKVTVNLGVGATAAQVVAAINADAAASALVTAYTYAGNAGGGAVLPIATTNLSDLLEAPATIPRGPFQPQVIRIGKVRDGSKVGVFLFCQQHAREWATPLTCVETAERLLRNYAIDPKTQEMVDNLDIFILPSVNPDGS
ncbi:MAG TPA: M14 family zinc carboxypeptidase, partial [Actinomycetota bacterium]